MKILIVIIILFSLSISAFSQDYEMGFSPFYAAQNDNINKGMGVSFFINFIKKRPLVFGLNVGGYGTTIKGIHSGELSNYEDNYTVKNLEFSAQYNKKIVYAGAGIGYYVLSYSFGEDLKNYLVRYDILGTSKIDNVFGFHLKSGINIEVSKKSYLNLEVKKYFIEPTIKMILTDLKTLSSIKKYESGSFDTLLLSIGYGFFF